MLVETSACQSWHMFLRHSVHMQSDLVCVPGKIPFIFLNISWKNHWIWMNISDNIAQRMLILQHLKIVCLLI